MKSILAAMAIIALAIPAPAFAACVKETGTYRTTPGQAPVYVPGRTVCTPGQSTASGGGSGGDGVGKAVLGAAIAIGAIWVLSSLGKAAASRSGTGLEVEPDIGQSAVRGGWKLEW